jgi:hypothetical protein
MMPARRWVVTDLDHFVVIGLIELIRLMESEAIVVRGERDSGDGRGGEAFYAARNHTTDHRPNRQAGEAMAYG